LPSTSDSERNDESRRHLLLVHRDHPRHGGTALGGRPKAGAEIRLRQVGELAPPEAIASNAAWSQHFDRTKDEPKAAADDVVWADAVLFGSPTRYGNIASQLKQFLDTLGPQWSQGLLADKVYAGFTASMTAHGGQESTLLALYNTIHHFGGVVVAPGYTDPLKFADGIPYGVSHVTGAATTFPWGRRSTPPWTTSRNG
jgi:NAD(P)H dehydrogenase (quinone)